MFDEIVSIEECWRTQQFAVEQLLIATLRAVCDLAPDPNAMRESISSNYERLAGKFEFRGEDLTATKRAWLNTYMINHGMEVLAQIDVTPSFPPAGI